MVDLKIYVDGVEKQGLTIVENCCVNDVVLKVTFTGDDATALEDCGQFEESSFDCEQIYLSLSSGFNDVVFEPCTYTPGINKKIEFIINTNICFARSYNFFINCTQYSETPPIVINVPILALPNDISCQTDLESDFDTPIPSCAQFPINQNEELIFGVLEAFPNLEDYRKKLVSSGFFGMFDKSNACANTIMDLHYLAFTLQLLHQEKRDDAIHCNACRLSKHPLYYIDKYNLCCAYESFKCKGIDILPMFKAAKLDKVYVYNCNYSYTGIDTYLPKVDYYPLDQLNICPGSAIVNGVLTYDPDETCCEPVDPEAEVVPECECCVEDYSSGCDWLFEAIKVQPDVVIVSPCDELFTTRNDESEDIFFTWRLDESYPCNEPYTFKIEETICDN